MCEIGGREDGTVDENKNNKFCFIRFIFLI